jgi:predicted metal-binding membrane protein
MLPAVLPAVRYVAGSSLYWRRRRAMTSFAAAYLAIWVAYGGVLYAALSAGQSVAGGPPFAAALALAAGWQLTQGKSKALSDCHRPLPLPQRGWRATAGAIRFGLWNGFACLRSCWAIMMAMAVANSPAIVWMTGFTAIVIAERFAQRPQRTTHVVAALLAASTLIVAVGAVVP